MATGDKLVTLDGLKVVFDNLKSDVNCIYPITDSSAYTWALKRNINSSGTTMEIDSMALTSAVPVGSAKWIQNATTGTGYDGAADSIWVHELDSNGTWKRRINIFAGERHYFSSDCASYRLAYGYLYASGITITQTMVDTYFKCRISDTVSDTLEEHEATLNGIVSPLNVAPITPAVETKTRGGIVFTKVTANKFQLSGQSTASTKTKVFHVLAGNNSTADSDATSTYYPKNISAPGTYTLHYTKTGNEDSVFAYTTASYPARVLVKNGESFTVADGAPVCFFAFCPSKRSYAEGEYSEVEFELTYAANVDFTAIDRIARENSANAIAAANRKRLSWGINNTVTSTKQMRYVEFTPVKKLPKTTSDGVNSASSYFPANETVTGLPYSSARAVDKMIGIDVTIKTFMSAIQNPRSVLYTRRLTTPNGNTYYGTVCSALVGYSYRLNGLNLPTHFLRAWDQLEQIDFTAMREGDCLINSGHAMLVTNLVQDDYGRISSVTITESIHPKVASSTKTFSAFKESYSDYKCYRYKPIDSVGYEALPYVIGYPDEIPDPVTYPDIMTEFGDAAVFLAGEDVKVNVLSTTDYSSITVTRGETTVLTTSTLEDFTLEDVSAGLYTITMSGQSKTTESTFFVVDCTCAFDTSTGEVSFASTNATPVAVAVYNNTPTNLPVILTDEDRTAGSIDVSDKMDENYQYAKVIFATPYGTAVWYSYDLHQWTDFDAD